MNNTVSIHVQPIINEQEGQNPEERERGGGRETQGERGEREGGGCVSLNLSSLHTLRPCVRSGTRAEPESTGVRELEAWPGAVGAEPAGGRGSPHTATGRVSMLLELKRSL